MSLKLLHENIIFKRNSENYHIINFKTFKIIFTEKEKYISKKNYILVKKKLN